MDNTLSDVYYTKSLIYLKKNDDLDCMLNLMVAGMRSTRYKEGYLLDPIFNDIGTTKEYIGIYGCVVRFNGKEILLKAQPEFIGNSAMIALEDICSQIGCSLKIDKKTNQYTIHNKAITISFRPNNRYAYVNGKKIDMKEKTIYKNNCLLVPVDFIGSHSIQRRMESQSKDSIYCYAGLLAKEYRYAERLGISDFWNNYAGKWMEG